MKYLTVDYITNVLDSVTDKTKRQMCSDVKTRQQICIIHYFSSSHGTGLKDRLLWFESLQFSLSAHPNKIVNIL